MTKLYLFQECKHGLTVEKSINIIYLIKKLKRNCVILVDVGEAFGKIQQTLFHDKNS